MNVQEEINEITNWMKNYINESQTKGFVIGLSGGIDSSVVATLAVNAVGKENVLGLIMPCYSNPQDAQDAYSIIDFLDISHNNINIYETFTALTKCNLTNNSVYNNKLINANIKARIRMTVLYTYSELHNYLVAGTGNLSELEIGYFTKYGDGGVDIEPIGNYYKTEVIKIAKKLNIPEQIITKPPSAGLWQDQTDEQEIGMTYEQLDEVLKAINNDDIKKIDKMDINTIENVKNMIKIAKHKNNAPPKYEREIENED